MKYCIGLLAVFLSFGCSVRAPMDGKVYFVDHFWGTCEEISLDDK